MYFNIIREMSFLVDTAYVYFLVSTHRFCLHFYILLTILGFEKLCPKEQLTFWVCVFIVHLFRVNNAFVRISFRNIAALLRF